jgi:hypothetical protein
VRSEPTYWKVSLFLLSYRAPKSGKVHTNFEDKGSTRSIRKRRSMGIRCRGVNMVGTSQASTLDMREVTLEVITDITIIITDTIRDQEVGLADWIVIVIVIR